MGIDLTDLQRRVLQEVFSRFRGRFARVAVFGSRATGKAHPGSDVDLVVYGADDRTMSDLWLAIEESDLSILFDLKNYEGMTNARLRAEIDRDALTFLDDAELRRSTEAVA